MARLKAIEIVYDRLLGKPPEHVTFDVEGDPPWKQMIASAIVATTEQVQDAEIVEGELLDDTEQEDDY